MTLILLYLVVLVLVATVLFGLGSVIFGRGETLPPLPRGTTATVLPASGVTGADVDALKFAQVVRGYKTSEVDWVLDRLGRELDAVRGELAAVRAAYGVPEDFEADADFEAADDGGTIVGTADGEVSATAGEVRTADES
ncbi:cell division protein DivIVA [Mycolicibacterium peregrinum]|uniref:Cell division protein DivIVA n=1 Tax=Mycolicibacterium peregrinum TaxID=43304 RepID=A0A1A0R9H7_MYCPR|nr:DivIVA domain-containing protein [Mycolicibacterium peregrinum]OBB30768.1 cell division protein DivIVA [Mycolicibacterium peregrinum]